jgi:pimeloyl-ACP methyl ester carboxylesterase
MNIFYHSIRLTVVFFMMLVVLPCSMLFAQSDSTKTRAQTQVGLPPLPPLVRFGREVPANTDARLTIELRRCQTPLNDDCAIPANATVTIFVCNVPVVVNASSITTFAGTTNIPVTIPGSVIPNANSQCDVRIEIRMANGTVSQIYGGLLFTTRPIYWVHGLGEEYSAFWGNPPWYTLTSYGYSSYVDGSRRANGKVIDYPTDKNGETDAPNSLQSLYNFGPTEGQKVLSIPDVAQRILSTTSPDINIEQRSVVAGDLPILITHSMGGLVGRSMARQIATSGVPNKRFGGIITVGTPNQGAPIVNSILSGAVGYAGDAAIREMSAGPTLSFIGGAVVAGLLVGCPLSPSVSGPLNLILGIYTTVGAPIVSPLLFFNSLLPVNPLVAWIVNNNISNQFRPNRPNIQDMFVIPDFIGGPTGRGAPFFSSPFLNEINSPVPGIGSVNPVPVINIYGTTNHEQPQYSIGSTGLETFPRNPQQFLCDPVPLKPQFLPIDAAKDDLLPKFIYQRLKPAYVATTALTGAAAIIAAVTGALPVAAAAFVASFQWNRGVRYIDFGAQAAYKKLIGASRYIPFINTVIFGFRLIVLSGAEEYFPSDAFIPEWSQKSAGAALQLEAEKTNHLIEANHPSMKRQFNRIFDDQASNPSFYIQLR